MTDLVEAFARALRKEISVLDMTQWYEYEDVARLARAIIPVVLASQSEAADFWKASAFEGDRQATMAEERVVKLEEALRFYADEARWRPTSYGVTPAMDDQGHRAREALKPKAQS